MRWLPGNVASVDWHQVHPRQIHVGNAPQYHLITRDIHLPGLLAAFHRPGQIPKAYLCVPANLEPTESGYER